MFKFGLGTDRERSLFSALSEVIAGFEHGDLSPLELAGRFERAAIIDDRAKVDEDLRMTPTDDIKQFLIARDPKEQKTTVLEFGTDYDAAQDAYQEAEQQARGTNLDVVLLSAESLETIKRTHSSYFDEEPNTVAGAIGGA